MSSGPPDPAQDEVNSEATPAREGEPRHVVVTGAGRGLGAALAEAFAVAGDHVLVCARSEREVEAVAAALRERGHRAAAAVCDVTSADSIGRLASRAQTELGPIDILVNNAGVGHAAPIGRVTLADWNRVMAVNVTGPMLCMQAFLPNMKARGWGRVIQIASVAGLKGARYISAYAASKHALIGLTESAAAEFAGTGVTINALCPGYVDTPMTESTIETVRARTGQDAEAALESILNTTGQPRLIQPNEVAAAALHLASDAGDAIHGQAIVLDGGGSIL